MHTSLCEEANPGAFVGRLGLPEHPRVVLVIEADAPAIAEMPRLVASTGELTDRQAHGRRDTARHCKQLTHGPIAFARLRALSDDCADASREPLPSACASSISRQRHYATPV